MKGHIMSVKKHHVIKKEKSIVKDSKSAGKSEKIRSSNPVSAEIPDLDAVVSLP